MKSKAIELLKILRLCPHRIHAGFHKTCSHVIPLDSTSFGSIPASSSLGSACISYRCMPGPVSSSEAPVAFFSRPGASTPTISLLSPFWSRTLRVFLRRLQINHVAIMPSTAAAPTATPIPAWVPGLRPSCLSSSKYGDPDSGDISVAIDVTASNDWKWISSP